ncbi:terminase large subunit domain-containing protein [Limnobaculum xujianqingii]|uniref:terminase large subunit domain-containing protein n=1 Tax=Limnobaculum xujianqingii TaxID=2738837 RepID=UPI0015C18839|nr:terminase family protein [Limnobaculum xujianqingii]
MKANSFTPTQIDDLQDNLLKNSFKYQLDWYHAGLSQRKRNLTKARQVGADSYFSREALIDSLTTGRNQQIIATSQKAALVLRSYITSFAAEVGVKLTTTNKDIYLSNGAMIGFHGEKSHFAALHGNVYVSEYAWMKDPKSVYQIAIGVAAHNQYRSTFYTSVSESESGFAIWNGSLIKQTKIPKGNIPIKNINNGQLCVDGQWRQSITIYQAMEQGCNLWDQESIKDIQDSMTAETFNRLYLCQWNNSERGNE